MVTWASDGTMAGYDPVTRKLKKGLFHFATPGTVDLNGFTRLNQPLGAGLSKTTYPNNLQCVAPLTYSPADFTNNPGRKLSVGLVMVRADHFPEGHVPTPSEVFNAPYDWAQRATEYVFGTGPITHTFELPTDTSAMGGFYWNTKWWLLLYPSAVSNVNGAWTRTNDKPLAGANINTVGRVVSFWSNHTPDKPTIASPVDGSQFLPGSEFTLTLNPNDPDEAIPEDAQKYNDDVSGVHFQYRPAPTAEVPNADWQELPFDWHPSTDFTPRRGEAWNIRGSRNWDGLSGTPFHEALVANLGCTVVAGAGDQPADLQPGKAALPTGTWQIRGRTFDYGHPYPNSGTVVTEPGPLGINPASQFLIEPAKDTYPVQDTSPWSDPVTVVIPAQVPPPLPIYPTDALAVSGNSVRLRWKYRNTHQPPRTQYLRTVQIRKVGDENWATVFSGLSADAFVDLPFDLVQSALPPLNMLSHNDFEDGSLGGWAQISLATDVVTNINNPAQAHSGNRYLQMSTTAVPPDNDALDAAMYQTWNTIPDDYIRFTLDGWCWVPPASQGFMTLQFYWSDALYNPIYPPWIDGIGYDLEWPYFTTFFSKPPLPTDADLGGWAKLSEMIPYSSEYDRLWITRHPDAEHLHVTVYPGTNILGTQMPPWRIDDWTLTATGIDLDPFQMEPTNQYEWRVQVTDEDNITSGYSTPARFWVVPAAASGDVRPIPANTIDGATLGCGTHRVEVYRRGGLERVGELTQISHVDWERKRDDMSTAQVIISGWDEDCGALLAELQTIAYEIVIHRDNGYSTERVWEGPITLLTYETDKVTIDAKDVMLWPYRRIIKQKMSDAGTGNGTTVVDRARRVIQNTMAPDDPNVLAYLQVLAQDDDAMQYRSTPAYSRTAYEEVDDMAANAGLDYTVVGRSILLWGTKHRIGTLPEMTDKDLGASPIVSEYGMNFADFYAVSDGNGVYGYATRGLDPVSGNNDDYGLIEKLSSTWASDSESDTGTYTQAGLETIKKSFEDFSERSISDLYPPPVVVRIPENTSLNPDTVLNIQQLVPGVAFPLRSTSTLRTVVATQKLDAMKVVEEAGKETITITCSPFSRDDAAVGEEGADA